MIAPKTTHCSIYYRAIDWIYSQVIPDGMTN